MPISCLLFHYGAFQPLWQQPGLLQAGPQILNGPNAIHVAQPSMRAVKQALALRGLRPGGVLLHYSDPFLIRAAPLQGLRQWPGPRLLACGDLHHGPHPIDTLANYIQTEAHDAVLLTFNPSLLQVVRQYLNIPVRSLPPTFFQYPAAASSPSQRRLELLHVGSIGPNHSKRRHLVNQLLARGQIPFRQATTTTTEEATNLYAKHALVLNVPLNNDLNHRFFEVMAAGVPQLVFGNPTLVGEHQHLAKRPDVFWASSLQQLEATVLSLFSRPKQLQNLFIAPPHYWKLKQLLKAALAP